ncbi:MAG TPA: hypothetical protein DCM08_02160, partial [Microscillaceae bacterium]|nr:hypothetical protein [Microscillaceae bacterium]
MIALVWGCRERQLPKPNLPTTAKPLSDPLAIRQQQLLQNAQQLHQTQTTLLTPQAQATQGFVELPTPLWNRATTKVLADGQILLHVPLQYQIDT